MQRLLPRRIATVLSIIAVTLAPGCKGDKAETDTQAAPPAAADDGVVAAAEPEDDGIAPAEVPIEATANPASEATGEPGEPDEPGDPDETEEPDEPAADTGAAPEPGEESPVAALYAQAKLLETDDPTAKQALVDAIAAGGERLEAAKIANTRGEALMAKGEGERAEEWFRWAADTHKRFSEPIYNLATLAAYAGDLELAKEHLEELKNRGNKKLMKKVGVDPAFALLIDDPEVRAIYER